MVCDCPDEAAGSPVASWKEEPGEASAPEGSLGSVSADEGALRRAQEISRRAVRAGFEWESLDDVWSQVDEEIAELKEAYAAASHDADGRVVGLAHDADERVVGLTGEEAGEASAARLAREAELEMGDVLFSLVNVARRMGLDAEAALAATCDKFCRRWAYMEDAARTRGVALESLSVEEQNKLWSEAKKLE